MTTQQSPTAPAGYALGHEDAELARLEHQAGVWAPFTERFLREAGVGRGMRVLDVGCGPGDVALLAARLVGPEGEVVGIDPSAEATALADRRAERLGLRWAEFRTGPVESLDEALGPGEPPFDAAVGRFVLEHLPDPVNALRAAAARVRPGGIVAFLEYDFAAHGICWPPVPLFTHTFGRIVAALAAAGVETAIGCKLHRLFADAGLPQPTVTTCSSIQAGPDAAGYRMMAEVTRTLLPVIERAGLATAAEVEVDTLEARLREAVTAAGAAIRSPDLAGGWCTLPAR